MAQGSPQERVRWREVGNEDEDEEDEDEDDDKIQTIQANSNRKAERFEISIPMPHASEVYFSACGKIDQHNRIRELVGIDKRIRTTNWAMRVNLSILSMIFTDAWLLFKACRGAHCDMNPRQFFEQLANELIDTQVHEGMKTRAFFIFENKVRNAYQKKVKLQATKLKRKGTEYAAQRKCFHCRAHTTTVCSRCSADPQGKEVFVCGKKKHASCWEFHLQTMHHD